MVLGVPRTFCLSYKTAEMSTDEMLFPAITYVVETENHPICARDHTYVV